MFDNRYPPLQVDPPAVPPHDPATAPAVGRCEVVLYTATHTGSLATLDPEELARVVGIWQDRSNALRADPQHEFALIFENRGEDVGANCPTRTARSTPSATSRRSRPDVCGCCRSIGPPRASA